MSDSTTELKQCSNKADCLHPEKIDDGWLPATIEYFCWRKENNKLRNDCRKCEAKKATERYWKNREKKLEKGKQWRERNQERHRQNAKDWYWNNLERQKKTSKIWRENNKEHRKQKYKEWYEKNRERSRLVCKNYYHRNIEKKRGMSKLRVSKRKTLKNSLPHSFSEQDWKYALKYFHYQCVTCGERLDIYNLFESEPKTSPMDGSLDSIIGSKS